MVAIATWGIHTIHETELISLRFRYGLRLAKFTTVFENPIIQYVGKDVVSLELVFRTWEEDKTYNIWNEKQALAASIRNLNIAGVNYGDFFLSNTEVEFLTHSYMMTDDGQFRQTNSTFIQAEIRLQGLQEMST